MARKTKVFPTACQKRVSTASVRTFSRPANDVDGPCTAYVARVGRERRPPREGARKASVPSQGSPIRKLTRLFDEQFVGCGRREVRHEARRRIGVTRCRKDRHAAEIRERIALIVRHAV